MAGGRISGDMLFPIFPGFGQKRKITTIKTLGFFFGGEKPSKMGFIIFREYNHKNWGFNYQRYD